LCSEYLPLNRHDRLGEHTGTVEYACVHTVLDAAKRSRFGVETLSWCMKPSAWRRHWSHMMKRMFGCETGGGLGADQDLVEVAAAVRAVIFKALRRVIFKRSLLP
jgi:hypothetical protein